MRHNSVKLVRVLQNNLLQNKIKDIILFDHTESGATKVSFYGTVDEFYGNNILNSGINVYNEELLSRYVGESIVHHNTIFIWLEPLRSATDPFYCAENLTKLKRSVAYMNRTGGIFHEVGNSTSDCKSFSKAAWDDFNYWKEHDDFMYQRIIKLIDDIAKNGYYGIGKPQRLSGDFSLYWSRYIDDKNRIVYRIVGETIQIIQCGANYRYDKETDGDSQ